MHNAIISALGNAQICIFEIAK